MNLKQNTSNQTNDTEKLSPVLEKLRHEVEGFKVPDGYFDLLSPRIVDSIQKQENNSISKKFVFPLRKPLVWAPLLATFGIAIVLIFVIPAKKPSAIQVGNEWTEINMAYDASYAEEALLAESTAIDKELESSVMSNFESVTLSPNEPTIDELTLYLEEQETDTDILNEY